MFGLTMLLYTKLLLFSCRQLSLFDNIYLKVYCFYILYVTHIMSIKQISIECSSSLNKLKCRSRYWNDTTHICNTYRSWFILTFFVLISTLDFAFSMPEDSFESFIEILCILRLVITTGIRNNLSDHPHIGVIADEHADRGGSGISIISFKWLHNHWMTWSQPFTLTYLNLILNPRSLHLICLVQLSFLRLFHSHCSS